MNSVQRIMIMHRPISLLTALLTVFVFQAHAHTALTVTTPADTAITSASPEELVLEFNGEVRLLNLSLISGADESVKLGSLPSTTQASFSIPVMAELAAGNYLVTWRAVGADTHPVSGEIRFSVAGGDSLAAR